MRISKVLLVVASIAVLLKCVNGQTVQVTGYVKDGNGHPLNAALITVDDAQENAVGHGVSNILGYYAIQARPGAATVLCEVFTDSVTYSPNPDRESLTIQSKSAKGNCTLYQVTKISAYWKQVGRTIYTKASTEHDASKIYSLEWKRIDTSGLPPDSKAAAARQFKSMAWSKNVADYTFTDYANVNQDRLTKALHGDQKALGLLPRSIAEDVREFNSSAK